MEGYGDLNGYSNLAGAGGSALGTMAKGGSGAEATGLGNGGYWTGSISYPASGGYPAVGGAWGMGGYIATGGYISVGGARTVGGYPATGGTIGVGGYRATGGTRAVMTTTPVGTPVIDNSGYVTVKAGNTVLMGFISSSTAGSGSSISLTYDSSQFCAKGEVAPNGAYKSWAVAGFGVNQSQTGASGSSGSLALYGSSVSLTYNDMGASPIEFQMYDATNGSYWCYMLPQATSATTITIPFSKLTTECWNGGGSAFTSGTSISAVNLVVSGSATTTTPYSFCFLGMAVQ